MKPLRVFAGVVVLGLVGSAVWLAGARRDTAPPETTASEEELAYDYEARDVVVRQMDPQGRLEYQLEAGQITQQPQDGQIAATGLTLTHDPPGSPPGGAQRWTMTAERALLPADGGVVVLEGNVRASGQLPGRRVPLDFSAAALRYDLDQQLITSEGEVAVTWGRGNVLRGGPLRADIKRDAVALESRVHGTLVP